MIELNGASKSYRTRDVETRALSNVTLSIDSGEFVSVMGPSGCGKTTLLNVLGMLDRLDSGSYRFDGEEISGCSEAQLSGIRKRHVGFIFQNFNLVTELTVRENIELALVYHRRKRAERRTKVAEAMEKTGIAHRANHMPTQLSGGQQQRVAIARVLALEPAVVLADEPTGNLDSIHGGDIMKLLQQLNDQGKTILMVTHNAQYARAAQRTIHLFDGKIAPAE